MNSKLLVFLGAFTLFGCSDDSAIVANQAAHSEDVVKLIEANKLVWTSSNIQTYTFTYYSPPTDCPNVDPYPPVEITVEEGTISRLFVPDLDVLLDIEDSRYPTINGIFIKMDEKSFNIKGVPTFDTTFGYPVKYGVDLSDAECDGYSVNVSSFI
jgi:hypothetical protein|tara:strand:+ start:156 stop:620 length:465 start_codon:yes stop_codon:yes gene_type:complete